MTPGTARLRLAQAQDELDLAQAAGEPQDVLDAIQARIDALLHRLGSTP